MKQHVEEYLKYMGEIDMLNQFQAWKVPKFPLTGVEIEGKGIPGNQIYFYKFYTFAGFTSFGILCQPVYS